MNPWGYPAKDRSGRLALLEPPDLGQLFAKITGNPRPTTTPLPAPADAAPPAGTPEISAPINT